MSEEQYDPDYNVVTYGKEYKCNWLYNWKTLILIYIKHCWPLDGIIVHYIYTHCTVLPSTRCSNKMHMATILFLSEADLMYAGTRSNALCWLAAEITCLIQILMTHADWLIGVTYIKQIIWILLNHHTWMFKVCMYMDEI